VSKAKNFNLSDLIQDHDEFTDVDSTVYEFRNQIEFGVAELARAQRWQKQLPTLADVLSKDPENVPAADNLDKIGHGMLKLILPELPEQRVAALPLAQVMAIVQFWVQRQRERSVGEEKKGQES